jgi:hypothetical protein
MMVWEAAALGLGLVGCLLGMGLGERAGLTQRWLGGLAGLSAKLTPSRRGSGRTLARPSGGLVDLGLIGLGLFTNLPLLISHWRRLSQELSPIGPDSDENFLAAVALFEGNWGLYPVNRYPGYPALVAAIARDGTELAAMGVRLSQAAAVGCAVLAYLLGRTLFGRFAGFAAMVLVLRLPAIADLGRQTTPYMVLAFLDLALLGASLQLAKGRKGWAVLVGILAGLVPLFDPKQLVFGLVAIGTGVILLSWPTLCPPKLGVRITGGLALVLGLPLMNQLAGRFPKTLPIVEITSRVDLGLGATGMRGGWALGDPLVGLPDALLRLGALQSGGSEWLHSLAGPGLTRMSPGTSAVWLLGLLGLGWCGPRPVLGLVGLWALAWPVLHLYYQHRYWLPVAVALPALVLAGWGRLIGNSGLVGICLVGLLWGGSPWSHGAPNLFSKQADGGEPWTGVDPGDWRRTRNVVVEQLPEGTRVLDFGASRQWTQLAGAFDYRRCTHTPDGCAGALGAAGPLAAVLFPEEAPSGRVPQASAAMQGQPSCWKRIYRRPGNGGLYLWTCPEAPR